MPEQGSLFWILAAVVLAIVFLIGMHFTRVIEYFARRDLEAIRKRENARRLEEIRRREQERGKGQ